MGRAGNDKEYLRTINMNRKIYAMLDNGEFTEYSDDNFYAQKTLSEVLGADKTLRYSSKFDDRKRKRTSKETRSKGRCNNKSYKLSESRFTKRGGKTNG